jgi:hypothetical protein
MRSITGRFITFNSYQGRAKYLQNDSFGLQGDSDANPGKDGGAKGAHRRVCLSHTCGDSESAQGYKGLTLGGA